MNEALAVEARLAAGDANAVAALRAGLPGVPTTLLHELMPGPPGPSCLRQLVPAFQPPSTP